MSVSNKGSWHYDKSNNWVYTKNNNNYTWENLQKDKNYANWTLNNKTNFKPFQSLPTNEEMKIDILNRVDDEGFFNDSLEWLRKTAPRKIRIFLKFLYRAEKPTRIIYEDLCEAVYQLGFRASEILERRMILGPTNEWVCQYFKDFPMGGKV